MLPAFPTGIKSISGESPRSSIISNAAVFCPSILRGLIEFTISTFNWSLVSFTKSKASSKFPLMAKIRAP